ncbi:TonB-dependent receptor plug domain-containing protein [Thiorhodococcus minor]|uniref:TonB-dependent receptor n=1 Tax=Thiorhodococcus minor TaxID=57489 RepID=A0A6M0K5V3_9GAMM|nr:TonB-dependent receptor [Thiorhodococcus minor]NEV63977.1 TonB-dependent receptor [Thiorhodococcus minor]
MVDSPIDGNQLRASRGDCGHLAHSRREEAFSAIPLHAGLAALLIMTALSLPLAAAEQSRPTLDADHDVATTDHSAKEDLLSVIDDVSSLATKTRMNSDYVPGILSMVDGEEALALGARTVWEALELVPGIQIDRNNNGGLRVAIRGFKHGNGNVKLLLNSVPINNSYSGYSNILYAPIEQVERIEVIRGPGSTVHGEFAFAGVINIITRKGENQAYLRAGSGESYGAGAMLSLQDPDQDWQLNLNAAGWDTQGTDVISGRDRLYAIGLGDLSQAPGPVNNAENDRLAVLSLDYRKFSLLAQYSRERRGTFFGALNALPEWEEGTGATFSEQTVVQARQELAPTETLGVEIKLTWWQYVGNWAEDVLPSGVSYPLGSENIYPEGVFLENYVRLSREEAEIKLDWRGWSGHHWQLDASAARIEIDDAWWAFNGDAETLEPLSTTIRYSGDQNYIDEGAARSIHSLALQDQLNLFEQLEITAGLRYDSYSDVGDNISPRLAAVWTITDEHLLKAQYAEAFFPPTMFQVYGNTGTSALGDFAVEPETVNTSELSYIYRRGTGVARVTLYHSQVDNLIVIESSNYRNRGRARLQGIETEWEQRLSPTWKVVANLSYSDTEDEEIGGPLAGAADWLGNLSVLYRPRSDLLLTGHLRYVGDRHRSADDKRDGLLPGYQDLALTLNWLDVGSTGLTLRAGVKNLLAQSIKSPAPADTYPDDYPLLEERTWWIQLSYQWR